MNFYDAYTQEVTSKGFLADYVRRAHPITGADFWCYNTSFTNPLIGAPPTNRIQTQADSDFVMTSISALARLAGFGFDGGDFITLQVTDLSDGKTFFNQPLFLRQISGMNGFPFKLSVPRIVRPNTNLQVSLVVTQNIYDMVWVSFSGTRVYYGVPT